jgi:hypothetical protein
MHFVSSLAWEDFGQSMLRYILCSRWYRSSLVIICCDEFSVRAVMGGFGQHMLIYVLCHRLHMRGLVNSCRVAFRFLAGMSCVWSTQLDMHFVYSHLWEYFGRCMLRCIMWPCWGLVNSC